MSTTTRSPGRSTSQATMQAADRRLSRRDVLATVGRGLVGAVAASVALPAGRAFASRDEAGSRGVELMRAWARGEISRGIAPAPMSWSLYVPVRGAAFVYPPEWAVTEISDPDVADFYDGNPAGAFVVAPDESAGVLLMNATANVPTHATDAAWAQLEQTAGKGRITRLVEDELPPILDVTRTFAAARAGDRVCAVLAQAMPDTVMGGTFLYFSLVVAEEDEFDRLAARVFLPLLLSQVTGGPGGGGGEEEEEGNGDDEDDDDA